MKLITAKSSDEEIAKFFGYDRIIDTIVKNKSEKVLHVGCLLLVADIIFVSDCHGLWKVTCYSNTLGPYYVEFGGNDWVYRVIYCDNKSKTHRVNGPAMSVYKEGKLIGEKYYMRDHLHNRIGPALREFYNGVWVNEFYLNGNRVSLDYFVKEKDNEFKDFTS